MPRATTDGEIHLLLVALWKGSFVPPPHWTSTLSPITVKIRRANIHQKREPHSHDYAVTSVRKENLIHSYRKEVLYQPVVLLITPSNNVLCSGASRDKWESKFHRSEKRNLFEVRMNLGLFFVWFWFTFFRRLAVRNIRLVSLIVQKCTSYRT